MIAVTDRHLFDSEPDPEKALVSRIRALLNPEAPFSVPRFLVLREKDLTEERYIALAEKVLSLPNPHRVPVVLHSFLRAAESLPAQGLHLSLPRLSELAETGPERLRSLPSLGCSVHTKEEAVRAVSLGASCLFAGNVFETSCKPGLSARGLPWLREIAASVRALSPEREVPVYAIGGVTAENLPELLSCGASDGCMRSGAMLGDGVVFPLSRRGPLTQVSGTSPAGGTPPGSED